MDDEELLAKALLAAQRVIKEKTLKLQETIRTKAWISDKKTAKAMGNSILGCT